MEKNWAARKILNRSFRISLAVGKTYALMMVERTIYNYTCETKALMPQCLWNVCSRGERTFFRTCTGGHSRSQDLRGFVPLCTLLCQSLPRFRLPLIAQSQFKTSKPRVRVTCAWVQEKNKQLKHLTSYQMQSDPSCSCCLASQIFQASFSWVRKFQRPGWRSRSSGHEDALTRLQ